MNIHVGTSGFSYKEWKPDFYPEKMSSTKWLEYYSQYMLTVELNNTFYRMPSKKAIQTWNDSVDADFRFAVKASRRITHFKRLKNIEGELEYLYSNLEGLGDKLGIVLFQLPPHLTKDVELLKMFLMQLPRAGHKALEFRHDSWFDEEIYEILRGSNAALCVSDDGERDVRDRMGKGIETARCGYVRLRREEYNRKDLGNWVQSIRSQSWEEAFVFFKHEQKAPQLALDFVSLLSS